MGAERTMTAFHSFTTKEIQPAGWLKRQLEIQADGLCGNLDRVWPDVQDSKWIGGTRDGWERVPYWLDGFIPMAYLLGREDLVRRAKKYVDAILSRQADDGWICPCSESERAGYDVWAYLLICKVLTVYADCSGDERIEQVLYKALKCLYAHIQEHPLFNWGKMRWFECLIPIFWLYDRVQAEWLIDLAKELKNQGFDYDKWFDSFAETAPKNEWRYDTHVVNLAMCLKSGALYSRISGEDPDAFAEKALSCLMKYHSMAAFHFTGDECLAGDSPVRGSELCGVVEAMYSYEILSEYSAAAKWGDALERLALNALPAAVSEDMWTHQYDQMTNQPQCSIMPEGKVVFGTNNGESHLFGLEPNYGCCTANFGQGFPKLALNIFKRTQNGFAAVLLLPASVSFSYDGAVINCECETDYPFSGEVKYTISVSEPKAFAFSVRIPQFAKKAEVNGSLVQTGQYYTIEKTWSGRETVVIKLDFEAELVKRPSGMYCLVRGPLLYALPVKARKVMHEYVRNGVERKFPYCDYELFPESEWRYCFASDVFTVRENSVSDVPFSAENPPVEIEAEMARIDWEITDGICAEKPLSCERRSPAQKVRLIPYGCAKLRMAELPYFRR